MIAIQKTRESAQREERQRLAQDLHDQLGADLTQIVLASGNNRRAAGRAEDVKGALSMIEQTGRQLVENLAEIVWLTKPSNDTLDHLASYLGDTTNAMLERAGLKCELKIPANFGDVAVDYSLRHDLVLAVKESVHNAIKHSQAATVCLSIELIQMNIVIVIRDDGRGFDSALEPKKGNGLANIRARLHSHRGEAKFDSNAQGTVVTLSSPLT